VVPKATVEAQLSTVVANDRPILQKALAAVLGNLPVDDVEIRLDLANGDVDALLSNGSRVCLLSLRALTDGAGVVSGAVGCLSDVTESVQLRQELEMRASVDELTSCLNRAATLELLEQTVRAPALPGQGSAVVFHRPRSVQERQRPLRSRGGRRPSRCGCRPPSWCGA
jgi:hypothetical protein